MKIGTALESFPCPYEETVRLLKKHGFDATCCGSENAQIGQIMALCKAEGLEVENYHAPFSGINAIWLDTPEGEDMLRRLMVSVETAATYEVPSIVVHLSSGETPPRISDAGLARFDRLMERARACGVTVAYENQRKLANLSMAFEAYPDAVFCWDNGHEACFTPGREYMPLFGNRLGAIHIHDNHCVYNGDEHLIPGDGSIDFDHAVAQIAQTNYAKSLMLELIASKTPSYVEMGADAFFARAAKAARRLADAVEQARCHS